MAAGEYNLTIEQGATFSRVITWTNSAGTQIDLTDYSVASQIRYKHSSETAIVDFTATITDDVNGEITISLTDTQTSALNPNTSASKYVWDMELTSSGGQVTRLLEGSVEVSPEVTR